MDKNPFQQAVKDGKPPPSVLDMVSKHDIDTSGKMFLRAPKTILEAIISSYIKDENVVAAIAAFRLKCMRFHQDDPNGPMMQWLYTELAGWRGINGAALVFALETAVGAISEVTTTSALRLPGAADLARRVKERKENEKVEKGKVQD